MHPLDLLRAETLSAPNCTFLCGDPVLFRRWPGAHEEPGRVVGRTLDPQPRYDIATADGDMVVNVTIVRLDEEALNAERAAGRPDKAERVPARPAATPAPAGSDAPEAA